MKLLMTILVDRILTWIVRITPKRSYCVLRGFPSYEDNLIAIYEKLILRNVQNIVWVTDDLSNRPEISDNRATIFVKRGGILDYFYSISSKYLFITHGHFLNAVPHNQCCVNLWHGIPYKVIGKLDGKKGRVDSIVVATSTMTKDIFSQSFGVDPARIFITGQARTDRLFLRDPASLRKQIYAAVTPNTKFLLWLPTFRETNLGGGRTDGRNIGNLFNCTDFQDIEFNNYLIDNDCVCFIKPHPMAVQRTVTNHSNLIHIDENWLKRNKTTLYQLTGAVDGLISDISSIIIDFMLLDRPIIILFEDLIEYDTTRGFSFNPIEDWLPAPVTKNFNAFMHELKFFVEGEDPHKDKRNALKSKFFFHNDAGSTDRILDLVFTEELHYKCAGSSVEKTSSNTQAEQ